jgi:hypothetical protein
LLFLYLWKEEYKIITKSAIIILLMTLLTTTPLFADWAFDDIRKAMKEGVSYDKLRALESKYKSRIIAGGGYVFLIRDAQSINGFEVHLVEEYDEEKLGSIVQGDVCIVIPGGSTYSKTVEKLEKGQHVAFTGKLDYIFGKTIYIKGSAKITPAE